jgi:hypothetical protein
MTSRPWIMQSPLMEKLSACRNIKSECVSHVLYSNALTYGAFCDVRVTCCALEAQLRLCRAEMLNVEWRKLSIGALGRYCVAEFRPGKIDLESEAMMRERCHGIRGLCRCCC